ncbi:MAG: hypothetical protein AAF713_21475 [Pseudomonadota bacterium]
MQRNATITASLLGFIALIGIWQGTEPDILEFETEETLIIGATNILLVYLVLALLIERGCEVAMDVLTAIGAVPPEDPAESEVAQPERRIASVLICLVFAAAIASIGLRLVEMILTTVTGPDFVAPESFRWIDMALTALILAGGSEGIHQIIRALPGSEKPAAVKR